MDLSEELTGATGRSYKVVLAFRFSEDKMKFDASADGDHVCASFVIARTIRHRQEKQNVGGFGPC